MKNVKTYSKTFILKQANEFWSKYGKQTTFRTKKEYIDYVLRNYEEYKKNTGIIEERRQKLIEDLKEKEQQLVKYLKFKKELEEKLKNKEGGK